jgi:hypothetical protein
MSGVVTNFEPTSEPQNFTEFARWVSGLDPIPELSNVRCYETFAGRNAAFQHDARFVFGPIAKLPELFEGNDDGFLVDDEAEAKVAELHAQNEKHLTRSKHEDGSPTDGMSQTRARWEQERESGKWAKETR